MDRVRNQQLPQAGPILDTLGKLQYSHSDCFSFQLMYVTTVLPSFLPSPDEAFTSENWLVRIYKVKKEDSLSRDHRSANAFQAGKRKKKVRGVRRSGKVVS